MNEKKIKDSKLQIQCLAELCINQISENKFLEEKKELYNKHLNFIKSILINKSNTLNIKKEITQLRDTLLLSNTSLKNENKILNNKLSLYQDNISKEGSFSEKQKLINAKSDNLLLIYQIKEKDDIIKRLSNALESLRINKYFKESKRESSVNNKWGHYYITLNLNNLAEKMIYQCQNFIQYNNKCFKKEKEKTQINDKKKYLNELINFYRNELGDKIKTEVSKKIKNSNKNNKTLLTQTMILKNEKELSLFEGKDDYLNDNLLINKEVNNNLNVNKTTQFEEDENQINKYISHEIKKKTKHKNSKFNFLTVDELFDVNNHEGKEEAIIDDELHSDEDLIFETKIKPLKKIGIHYLPKIKKQVPFINLSQIEYNKQKVMNEADLYSLQRRKFKNQNVDENIKNIKKKVKKYKYKCKLNKKKMNVFENYAKNIENNYKALKPLKIQSSLGGVKIPKIQNFFTNGINNNDNMLDDIDLGDDDMDNLEEDELDINNNETYTGTITIGDKSNIHIYNLNKKNLKQKESDKKIREDLNKLNRINSK